MTHEEAKAKLGTNHVYLGVSTLEVLNCPVAKWVTEVDGKTLLGTNEPYLAVAAKELTEE